MNPHWLNPKDTRTFASRGAQIGEGVVRESLEKTPYWFSTSRAAVQDFTMFFAKHGKSHERNLPYVARVLNGDMFHAARWMIQHTNDPYLKARLRRWANPDAQEIRSMNEVQENIRTEIAFLLDQPTAEALMHGDVSFSRCKRSVTSIYIIAPGAEETDGRFFKLMMCCALGELLRFDAKGNKRTLIMADEYYSLRYRDGDRIFATARKFNVVPWFCMQDMTQLRALSQTHESLINNAGVVQFLDAGDLQGSMYVSSMAGDTEVYGHNKSFNTDFDRGGVQISNSMGQQARRLILPHEVRELGPREQILFVDGVKGAIKAARKPYFETRLKRKAMANPYAPKQGFLRKIWG